MFWCVSKHFIFGWRTEGTQPPSILHGDKKIAKVAMPRIPP